MFIEDETKSPLRRVVDRIDARMDRALQQLDAIERRLVKLEAQVEWAQKIAAKETEVVAEQLYD